MEKSINLKKSNVGTIIIAWTICLLVWLIIWFVSQQLLSQRAKCDAPVQLNIPSQNNV